MRSEKLEHITTWTFTPNEVCEAILGYTDKSHISLVSDVVRCH